MSNVSTVAYINPEKEIIVINPEKEIIVPVKEWWKSKTVIINALFVLLYAATLIIDLATPLGLSAQVVLWLGVAQAVVNFALRLITAQPIQGTPAAKNPPTLME